MRNAWVLLVLAAAVNAGEPPGDFFENRSFGFKLRVPKDWREVPTDQTWIASKHLGKRELDAQRGTHWSRGTPELWVVAFPKGEDKMGNPYTDYRDFVTKSR